MARGTEREPICGFCWAYRHIRQPLEFRPRDGWWECPICLAKIINPSEDEEEIRAFLLRNYDPDPNRHEKTIASTLRLRGRRSTKSGRRRKKPSKPNRAAATEYERYKHDTRMAGKRLTKQEGGV